MSKIYSKNSNFIINTILLISCFITIFLVWQYWLHTLWLQIYNYTIDDSFITYRYAENLRTTGQLVWNQGEIQPTEGYTSILWVLTMAFSQGISDIVLSAKLISTGLIIASAAWIFIASAMLHRSLSGILLAVIATILFLLNTDLVMHMISGMETALAIFLSVIFFTSMIALSEKLNRSQDFPSYQTILLSFTGLFCALTRPEFNLVFLIFFISLIIFYKKYRHEIFKCLLLPYVIIAIFYMSWRLYYYGPIFPLPFYIKLASGKLAGIHEVISFYLKILPIIPWVLIAIVFKEKRLALTPALLAILAFSIFFLSPAHIMDIANRFMIPLYGPLCFIAAIGIQETFKWGNTMRWRLCLTALVIISIFSLYQLNDKDIKIGAQWYSEGLSNAHIKLGKALHAYGSNHTLAIGDAGAAPFFSKWKTIDIFGLNNKEIALAKSKKAYYPQYIIDQNPDILTLISNECTKLTTPKEIIYEKQLSKSALKSGYEKIGIIKFQSNYFLFLYAKDTLFTSQLVNDFKKEHIFYNCT